MKINKIVILNKFFQPKIKIIRDGGGIKAKKKRNETGNGEHFNIHSVLQYIEAKAELKRECGKFQYASAPAVHLLNLKFCFYSCILKAFQEIYEYFHKLNMAKSGNKL